MLFLIKLLNILKGYVVILVEGFFLERFINICTRRGIHLWNVRRIDNTKMRANISIQAFKMLPPIAKKSRCTVQIFSRKGAPFFVYKHRKRKAFAVGIIISAILIYSMTLFIWTVDIQGNEKMTVDQITSALQNAGLKTGMWKNNIDTQYIQNVIMTAEPDIAWIGININGTKAEVEVKERAPKPYIVPKNEPCSIVATMGGVIETINTKDGHQLVKKGDVVREGQLLVSGALDSKIEGIRYVHSEAEVLARTWHEKTVDLPQFEEVKTRTGRSKGKHLIKIFDFSIKFFINDRIYYTNYDRISYVKKLSLGKDNILPISFHYDKYYEQNLTQNELTNEQAIEKIKTEMDNEFKDIQIVSKKDLIHDNKLTITYECIQNIAKQQEVLKEETNDNGGQKP